MNIQPTFSIIMCNYNNSHFIEQALDSVLCQTFQDWELSLLDDCSTDNSMEIIRKYQEKDSRIKVYQNEKNLGYGGSVAKNIALANGKYGAILDPDDALVPEALQIMYNTLQSDKNIIAAYSQMFYCDANLVPEKIFEYTRKIPPGTTYLEYGNMAMTHFFCFDRQKFIDYGNVDLNFRNALDQDWYYKIEEIGDVIFVEKPLYYYRVSPTGLSQGVKKRYLTLKDHLEIKKKAIKRRNIKDKRLIHKILKNTKMEIYYYQAKYLQEAKTPMYIIPKLKLLLLKIYYKIKRI